MSSQNAPWDAGMIATADRLNNPFGPHAKVYRSTDQTGVTSGAFVAVTWTSVAWNHGSVWNAGTPTRLTVPAGAGGLYHMECQMQWDDQDTGIRMVFLRVNGTTSYATDRKQAIDSTETHLCAEQYLVAGDYVEMVLLQSSGANRTVLGQNALTLQNPYLALRRIYPTV